MLLFLFKFSFRGTLQEREDMNNLGNEGTGVHDVKFLKNQEKLIVKLKNYSVHPETSVC